MTPNRPRITWPRLLLAAPYFSSVVFDVLDDTTGLGRRAARAAYYFDEFDGEVSNGGVMQYFFNQAFRDPAFGKAPEFIAENPVPAPAMRFVTDVHGAWDEVALDVIKARAKDDWPEELFTAHRDRFEALETALAANATCVASRRTVAISRPPARAAPAGTGRLHECLPPEEGRIYWREGRLVDGRIQGTLRWMESEADGTGARETGSAEFEDGVEQ